MNRLWNTYKEKVQDMRPFLRTKLGSRLAILGIIDFVILFLAPMLHGFVGVAIFGCVCSVYLMLMWRKHDKEHVIVPTVILCIPMLLDMLIYSGHDQIRAIIAGFIVTMAAMLVVALVPKIPFFDNVTDRMTSLLIAGALCVVVVVVACITLVLVNIAWWILCIIAFFIVVAIFMGVVFSTAAYTASDGRRQARRIRERKEKDQEQRYREYRPRERDTKVYNLDENDIRDVSGQDTDDMFEEDDFISFE